MPIRSLALALAVLSLFSSPPRAVAEDDLRAKVEVLTEEVRRLREQISIPETDEELESRHGLSPIASRVYGRQGLSIGGYGEFHFEQPVEDRGAPRTADFLRFITYFGYKFSDAVVMNTELEYEHATTESNFEGSAGSVSVEFSYVDFLIRRELNIRAGNLLVPMGFVNRMHEPLFFRGNSRPEIERRLLPTTWRELGVGIHGEVGAGVAYDAYVVNGLDAMRFDGNGIRGGRQSGNRVLWEDVGAVVSMDVTSLRYWRFGGSAYYGQADQNRRFDGRDISATVGIAEGHAELRRGGFQGRALVTSVTIGDADAISRELSDASGTAVIPERQLGWYLEGAYDVAPLLGIAPATELLAWVRREDWDLQREVPEGFQRSAARDGQAWTLGLELKPHPSVVVKADITIDDDEAGGEGLDPFRVGVGFVY